MKEPTKKEERKIKRKEGRKGRNVKVNERRCKEIILH